MSNPSTYFINPQQETSIFADKISGANSVDLLPVPITNRIANIEDDISNLKKNLIKLALYNDLKQSTISHLFNAKYLLKKEIPIQIIYLANDNKYLIKSGNADVYGTGKTEKYAIKDFCENLIEDYEDLKNSQHLGKSLQNQFNYYKQLITNGHKNKKSN